MARAMHPDSAGSQFFHYAQDCPASGRRSMLHLVRSSKVWILWIRLLRQIQITDDRPLEEQKMKKVTVETLGTEYPEPEKA